MLGDARQAGQAQFNVGIALLPAKAVKHVSSGLVGACAAHGISVTVVDLNQRLQSQGPFAAVLHKLNVDKEWVAELDAYAKQNPGLRLVDPPASISQLHDRATMLAPLQGEGIRLQAERGEAAGQETVLVGAPQQLTLDEGTALPDALAAVGAAGLAAPLLAKPRWTDGRPGSHALALVRRLAPGLERLVAGGAPGGMALPVVLQQFEEHGGCLFKVYVLGNSAVMVRRPSLCLDAAAARLPTAAPGSPCSAACLDADSGEAITCLPRISSAHSPALPGQQEPPPRWVVEALACRLRAALRLQLFNFDLLRPCRPPGGGRPDYLVVDINYFPGYEKLAGYDALMAHFLQRLLAGQLDNFGSAIELVSA